MALPAITSSGFEGTTGQPGTVPNLDLYRHLVEIVSDGIYIVDRHRRITFWNSVAERLTGHRAADVLGSRCADGILNHCDSSGDILCGKRCPLVGTMRDGQPRTVEAFFRHKDGNRVPVEIRSSPLRNEDGIIVGCAEVFSDRSPHNALLEQLAAAKVVAHTDPLTGTANRRRLEETVRSFGGKRAHPEGGVGFIFIDIDHFKSINDRWGHEAGDRVLKAVATTLGGVLRSFDILGRWGGEEFLVIAPGLNLAEAGGLAGRLRAMVSAINVPVEDGGVEVTISAGVTVLREGESGAEALERADNLMYASKRNGRNQVTTDLPLDGGLLPQGVPERQAADLQ